MKNKKWLLVVIIAFPSLFWLILETSTINSRRLPYHGPKVVTGSGDTAYHKASTPYLAATTEKKLFADTSSLLYAVCFLGPEYRKDSYRIAGLWEFLNFKKEKISPLPVVFLAHDQRSDSAMADLQELNSYDNVVLTSLSPKEFSKLRKNHFAEKPYYVDYSYFVLIDEYRHIRGYYDARYASEIKRLLQEYQHLKLKEVKKEMIETNEIRTKN